MYCNIECNKLCSAENIILLANSVLSLVSFLYIYNAWCIMSS